MLPLGNAAEDPFFCMIPPVKLDFCSNCFLKFVLMVRINLMVEGGIHGGDFGTTSRDDAATSAATKFCARSIEFARCPTGLSAEPNGPNYGRRSGDNQLVRRDGGKRTAPRYRIS